MTEEDARAWVRTRFGVSRETQLAAFGELVRAESQRQNLVAASTLDQLWTRHLLDSAQLVPLAEGAGQGAWVDIGSGAGFPGIVVAALIERPVVLVEPRGKRATFLADAARDLGLGNIQVVAAKVEAFQPDAPAAIVSARAVAALPALLASAAHCTTPSTIWLLPKGRSAQSEVEAARQSWQGSFHVEQSITESQSMIVVARGVRRR